MDEKQKTKILLIVEATLGGLRQHVVDIATNLDRTHYEVYLAYSDGRADEKFFEDLENLRSNTTLIRCEYMQRELGTHDLKAIRELRKIMKEVKPDIVHCHSSKAGIVGRVAAKTSGVRKVFYTPNAYSFQSPDLSEKKRKVYVMAERFLSRHMTTKTINVSLGEMNLALQNKLDKKDKFCLIYNGIPQQEQPDKQELRKNFHFSAGHILVGVTARFAAQKDPMTFCKIAKNVVEQNPKAHFIYIGDGELEEEVRQWMKKEQMEEHIHLLGFRSDASRLVGMLDIYLSTALYEGLPYSMIEAMRAGVPLIATDVVGNNELVIDGVNGYLFPKKDVREGARRVMDQIEHHGIQTEDVIQSFEERFSLNCMMTKLENLFGADIKS